MATVGKTSFLCDIDETALLRLTQAGAIITNSESVLFVWLRDAKHEHFKTLQSLIK